MKFACKKFITPQGVMLAGCDKELVGKKLKHEELEIEIKESFYFEKFCSEEELLELLKEAKIVNLFGNKIMELLVSKNIVKKENFKIVGGVAHIQIYKI